MKRRLSLLLIFAMLLSLLCACAPSEKDLFLPEAENDVIFATTEGSEGELEVHFIDVGQADAALVLCGEEAMLIDGGNADDSSLIYTYLRDNGIDYLDYVIATHPHEDHIGGLPGALAAAEVGKILSPIKDSDNEFFAKLSKSARENGVEISVPRVGDSFSLGEAEVEILGPVRTDYEDINNASLILRVVYGETEFLFTGDAERESEQDILALGKDISADVLKVGHHGSRDSSTYPFLSAIMPEYAVISVGRDNSYGHPTEEAISRLRDAGANILRTDELGDIIFRSDGDSLELLREKEKNFFRELIKFIMSEEFVLNTSSKKFHLPECGGIKDIKKENKEEFFGLRGELIDLGYSPCGSCNP